MKREITISILMLIFIVTIVGLVLEGNIDAKSPINKINNDNLDVAKTTNDVYDESSLINIYVPFSKNNADEAIAKPTLEEACQYIMDSDIEGGIIHITENISVDQMNLNKNVKVIIKSDDSTPYTITKNGSEKNMFLVQNGGTVILENITIDATNNTDGRTISIEGNSSLILNKNSLLENNNSYGAVFAKGASTVIMNGGTISNNYTRNGRNTYTSGESYHGGAVFYIENSSFEMNSGSLLNNGALVGGAIMGVNPETMNINGGTIEGNKTIDLNNGATQMGGAIACANNSDTFELTINVKSEAVFKSNSGHHGGVFYVMGKNTIINVDGAKFTNNSGRNYGGIFNVQCSDSKIILSGCEFKNTTVNAGGTIYANKNTNIDISKCTFENCTTMAGGAIVHQGYDYTMNIKDSTFTGNKATALEAGVIYAENVKNGKLGVTLENCTFEGNSSHEDGGAVKVFANETIDSSFSMIDCKFLNNETTNGSSGAVCAMNIKNISVTNCEFIGNEAEGSGGGMCIFNPGSLETFAQIYGGKFKNNIAHGFGGGMMINAYKGNIIVDGGTEFSENTADACCGGLYVGRAGDGDTADLKIALLECDIINNISNGDLTTAEKHSSHTEEDARVAVTTIHYNPGGLYIGESVTLYINDALITNNTVEAGYEGNVIGTGVGLCPNAEAFFYESGNVSIYGNGTGNGMDILAVPYDPYVRREELPKLYVAEKTSNGMNYNWTGLNGEEMRTGNFNWDEPINNIEDTTRAQNILSQEEQIESEKTLDPIGFKANIGSSVKKSLSAKDDEYKVHIMGNLSKNSTYGAGGLQVNGKVIASDFTITVEKEIIIEGECSDEKKQEISNRDFKFNFTMADNKSDIINIPTSSGQNLTKTDLEGNSPVTEAITWEQYEESNIGFSFTLKGNQKMKTDEIRKTDVNIHNDNFLNLTLTETDSGGANEVTISPENDIYDVTHSVVTDFVFTCTNTFRFGGLNITKTVENGGDVNKNWTFNIHIDNINGEYFAELWNDNKKISDTHVSFVSGDANITLQHGQTLKIKDLPIGVTYSVSETTDENYTTSSTGETGTISAETIAEATFTNKIKTGSLCVSKTVTGSDESENEEFEFTVKLNNTTISGQYGDMTFDKGVATFLLEHGESKTASNLPAGTGYTVTEKENENYTTTSSNETGIIVGNEEINVDFINVKLSKGSLTLSKMIESKNQADKEQTFNFTITLNDNSINGIYGEIEFKDGVASLSLKHGESKSASNLPADIEYTVTEEENEDYDTTSLNATGTIIDGEEIKVSFVNAKKEKSEVEPPPVEDPPKEEPPVETPPTEDPPIEEPPIKDPPVVSPEEEPPVEEPSNVITEEKVLPNTGNLNIMFLFGIIVTFIIISYAMCKKYSNIK